MRLNWYLKGSRCSRNICLGEEQRAAYVRELVIDIFAVSPCCMEQFPKPRETVISVITAAQDSHLRCADWLYFLSDEVVLKLKLGSWKALCTLPLMLVLWRTVVPQLEWEITVFWTESNRLDDKVQLQPSSLRLFFSFLKSDCWSLCLQACFVHWVQFH